jgi:prepilin signal peptidase PulO-like enzyme (type II secretory pathway)
MVSHLLLMVVYAGVVSTVFSFVMKKDNRERLKFGIIFFLSFLVFALVVGWIMYPFPG